MLGFKFHRILTGIEIDSASVKIAQVKRGKKGWTLIRCGTVPFPEDTIRLSYKTDNINEPQLFLDTIRKAVEMVGGKAFRVGLSVPNELVKVSIQKYADLPKTRTEIEKMIAWWAKRSMAFPVERAKISYHMISERTSSEKMLLITIAFRDVIREYELYLKESRIDPEVIRPAGINHFNVYKERILPTGTVAFCGLFDHFFTFSVFEDGDIIFYHGVKRGFTDPHFFQDMDMTYQLFLNENPDRDIERVYLGSQAGYMRELMEGFRDLRDAEVSVIDESEIISIDDELSEVGDDVELSSYISAIGAAQSLAQ
jgi:Tfp pilus assembly PilM family ATPase